MASVQRQIGYEVVGLSDLLQRTAEPILTQSGWQLTSMQMAVLCYLDERRNQNVFQRDLARAFGLRRSTATVTLQALEREGYIVRRPVMCDARLKKLILTERGELACAAARRQMERTERCVRNGMSEEELGILVSLLDRIRMNLETGTV